MSEKPKRDWVSTFIDVVAVLLIGGTVAFVFGIFIYVLRIMRVLP